MKKFTHRSKAPSGAHIACPNCKEICGTYDLFKNGKIVGIGCCKCFKNLPILSEKKRA